MGTYAFTESDLGWLKPGLHLGADLLTSMVRLATEATDKARGQVGDGDSYEADDHALPPFFKEDLLADAGWLQSEVVNLVFVATYHWVEREMKSYAHRIEARKAASLPAQPVKKAAKKKPPRKKRVVKKAPKSTSTIDRMNAEVLEDFFRKNGITPSQAPHHPAIVVMRLFANSWKHSEGADDDIRAHLDLPEDGQKLMIATSLGDKTLRASIAAKFGLAKNAEDHEIVKAAIEQAHAYLLGVAKLH